MLKLRVFTFGFQLVIFLTILNHYKGGGAQCQNSEPQVCLDGGWEILYLELTDLHDFFQTMLTIQ